MLHPSLRRIASFARRRYRSVFLVALVAVAASLAGASRLSFDTDVLGLLPRKSPEVEDFRKALEDFGSVDYLLVAVRLPEEAVLAPYETFVEMLGERLTEIESLTEVRYRIGDLDAIVNSFLPRALLFLSDEELEELADRLEDDAIRQRARELRRLITTPRLLIQKDLVLLDPLGVADVFLDVLAGSSSGFAVNWQQGFFLSKDRRMMLLLAKPDGPPQDVDYAKGLIEAVEGKVEATVAAWRERFDGEDLIEPTVALGGRHVIVVGDAGSIRSDVVSNIATSMLGVLVLFYLAFRRLGLLLYAFVPLACGLVLTFGVASGLYGTLSAATSGVAALLVGLGIDFIIVSYGRYVEERHRGQDHDDALATMSGSSGRAVFIGGVTSAATFYAFMVTDFTGLLQMGLLTGTGILLCMVSVLFLLPAMLSWAEDRHSRRQTLPRLNLHGFGSGWLIRWVLRKRRLVLVLGALITLAAAAGLGGLRFEDSVQAMRPKGNPGVEVRDEVAERFGIGFDQMVLMASGEDLDEVLELTQRAQEGGESLMAEDVLRDVDSIATILPPPARQEAALTWLEAARSDRLAPARIARTFREAVAAEGLRIEPFERGLTLLESALSRDRPLSIEEVRRDPQAGQLVDRYLSLEGSTWTSAVYLYPPAKTWRREPPPGAEALVRELGPSVRLTGANVISRYMRERVLDDAVFAAILGFVLVAILLYFDFRNLRSTALALGPLVLGIVWMLGAMGWLGLPMNFMNIFVTTMIIGIGVDYGVHMVHRHREFATAGREQRHQGMVETGKAITLAALSTIVGFGSLSGSSYPGLSSMGVVAILGAVATGIVAITVLPAFLSLINRLDGDGT